MQIAAVRESDFAEFLELVNAEIRPDRANTTAQDDFPLILGPENRAWQLVARTPDGTLAGCIAGLIRCVRTNWGDVQVAGIGSVVTHPDFRGQNLSSLLQNEMLTRLRGKNVPLAVLWTDQPEIYAGRGFVPAGWELHVDFSAAKLPANLPDGLSARPFAPSDVEAVEALYFRHSRHTRRLPHDSRALYTMGGTLGWVLEQGDGSLQAAVFCGKGADFPHYVLEWSGDIPQVLSLLTVVRERDLAHTILVPCGSEALATTLIEAGAEGFVVPAGLWVVLDSDVLLALAHDHDEPVPTDPGDPAQWLGKVAEDGEILSGPLEMAIWGFDSV